MPALGTSTLKVRRDADNAVPTCRLPYLEVPPPLLVTSWTTAIGGSDTSCPILVLDSQRDKRLAQIGRMRKA